MVFISNPKLRYLYSTLTGLTINVFMYEWQVIHPIIMMLLTWGIMHMCKRDQQQIIIFVVLYVYQSGMHIERMIYHYGEWGGEVTSFTMNLVCRLISLGFCYRDGANPEETKKINDKHIEDIPSFAKILGYTYNIPSCVASPFFEYKDYEDWIELKGDYAHIPDTFHEGVRRFSAGILWVSLTAVLTIWYKPEFLATEAFCEKSFIRQNFQQYMSLTAIKYTYFSVFAFNDGACVISGLAYNAGDKTNKHPRFDRVKNIDETTIEADFYLKRKVEAWNMTIALWLKKYVYLRLVSYSKGKPGVLEFLTTFVISAFWHGFYPGYYFFFFYVGPLIYLTGEFKYFYSWYFNFMPQKMRRFMAGFVTFYLFSYIVPVFAIYSLRDIFYYHSCQYFYCHIIVYGVFALSMSPLGVKLKRHIHKMKKLEKEQLEKKSK